jgi:starvation-inducible DNA-binding protein
MMSFDIEESARVEIADSLAVLLADSYTLYLKTQNYHWNVTGPMFPGLHTMFEVEYLELRDAVDVIAERIRALGRPAPASFKAFGDLTSIAEADKVPDALDMVRNLAAGHETVARSARAVVEKAEPAGDIATADLATGRVEIHEKTAWMLRTTGG